MTFILIGLFFLSCGLSNSISHKKKFQNVFPSFLLSLSLFHSLLLSFHILSLPLTLSISHKHSPFFYCVNFWAFYISHVFHFFSLFVLSVCISIYLSVCLSLSLSLQNTLSLANSSLIFQLLLNNLTTFKSHNFIKGRNFSCT